MEVIQIKVITLLQKLSSRFPLMTFTYGYDSFVEQHIVDVVPTELYTSDEYMEAEGDVQEKFASIFPSESLLFTSNNPFIHVGEPLFVAKGRMAILDRLHVENTKDAVFVDSHWANPTMAIEELVSNILTDDKVRRGKVAVSQIAGINIMATSDEELGEYYFAMAA